MLSSVLKQYNSWIKQYFSPEYKVDKVLKSILLNKRYYLFDRLMAILLRIKFQKMFGSVV